MIELLTGKTIYAVWIDHGDSRELVGLSATPDHARIIKRRLSLNVDGLKIDIVEMVIGKMESLFL